MDVVETEENDFLWNSRLKWLNNFLSNHDGVPDDDDVEDDDDEEFVVDKPIFGPVVVVVAVADEDDEEDSDGAQLFLRSYDDVKIVSLIRRWGK